MRSEEVAAVLERIAWYDETSGGETHPVGQKEPNPLGLYDMLGNVWEWCADWHGPYQAGLQVDPVGPPTGSQRVVRGGSWGNLARRMRATSRSAYDPGDRVGALGFRLAGGQGSAPGRQGTQRSGS